MGHEPNPGNSRPSWLPQLAMCAVCLGMGLLAGYLLRGSASGPVALSAAAKTTAPSSPGMAAPAAPSPAALSPAGPSPAGPSQSAQQMPHKMPTLDDMKRMADKKAAPLLEKLKSDAKNPQLENQIGLIYESAHQFKTAAGYFEKSLHYDPKNIGVHADYASCLYYSGDVDGALKQLNQSLIYDPKHAGTLMNIGIIRWKGKNDADGAVAAWEKLLQYHPDFPQKDLIQHMITQAKQTKAKTLGEGQKG
jgi:cytochrome c-type biogenesis protein CcmH/NrfG